MRVTQDHLLTVTDLAATGVFAVEGALAGAIAGLDLFGIVVLAFLTAVGGGIVRDLLLGETPPAALRSKIYPVAIAMGAAAAIVVYELPGPIPGEVLTVLDAGGLALFAATGTAKARDHGTHAWVAVLLGVITGCGGGLLRDIMLNRVPIVLTGHIYALAAAFGSVLILTVERSMSRTVAFTVGIGGCIALRLISAALDWNLPRLTG